MQGLDHTLWIGGPSGSGKSTIGRQIARRWGLRLYACDTRTWEHRDQAIVDGVDAAIRWEALTPAERDALLPADHRALEAIPERQAMVVADLAALPVSPLVVAEGALLPPDKAEPTRSVWLVPTREFQARHRHDPERRTEPMDVVVAAATRHGIPIVVIDGSRTVAEIAAEVESRFAGALAAGPRATTLIERRALLREANLDVVNQIRAGCSRPWATADPDVQVRTFTCECGETSCDADVETTVGIAATRPLFAGGHAAS